MLIAMATIALHFLGLKILYGELSPSRTPFAEYSLGLLDLSGVAGAGHMVASLKVFNSDDFSKQSEGLVLIRSEAESGSCYSQGKLGWAYQRGLGGGGY